MRNNCRQFVRAAESVFHLPEPIYEFGSFQVEGQESLSDLRSLFPGKKYVGCDQQSGKGVDRIEDLERLSLADGSVGSAILIDTLEHVHRPETAMKEVCRVLRPDGIVLASSVMDFPIHNYPHDYWRFTPEGFRSLLAPFAQTIAGFQGYPPVPHSVFAIGFKDARRDLSADFEKFKIDCGLSMKTGNLPTPLKLQAIRTARSLAQWMGRQRLYGSLDRYVSADHLQFNLSK